MSSSGDTLKWLSIATIVGSAASGGPVQGQTMDYGALEQVFGEPVTTSVTGSPQRATDVPANMEIITAEDIRRSGAANIPDILQFVAGLDVRRYSASQAAVAVRGYNQAYSPRLLVLINGRQVYLDDYGRTGWETLPVALDEIRQIEVVKGPNSALFGFNALAGVINIITYNPAVDSTTAVTVRGGSNNFASGSAVGTIPLGDRSGLRLSIRGGRTDEYPTNNLPPPAAPLYTTPFNYSLSADGRFALAPHITLTAEATGSRMMSFDVSPIPSVSARATVTTNSLKVGIDADTRYGLINLTAYRNGLKTNYKPFPGQAFRQRNRVYVVQASDLFKIGASHTFRVGLEYRDNAADGPSYGGTIAYKVYAASAMWSWQISPTLSSTNSVRVDHLKLRGDGDLPVGQRYSRADFNRARLTAVSFNSGVVFQATPSDTLRLMVARGIQAPSLTEFGVQTSGQFGPIRLTFAGNPNLKPASIMNYEINYDRSLEPLMSTLRVSAYYQKTTNLLTSAFNVPLTFGPTGLASYSRNFGSSEAYGGEIGLKGKSPSGWRWSASYAVISIKDRSALAGAGGFASVLDYENGTPTSIIRAGAGHSWNRFEVDVQGKWQSHFIDYTSGASGVIQPLRIGDHVTFNARVGYNLTDHVTLAVTGERLTRSRIIEAAGATLERRFFVSLHIRR